MNGKLWDISKAIIIAAIVGLIAMYGTVGKLDAKFDMLRDQVSVITGTLNGHITQYNIHIPHKDFGSGKNLGFDIKKDERR